MSEVQLAIVCLGIALGLPALAFMVAWWRIDAAFVEALLGR